MVILSTIIPPGSCILLYLVTKTFAARMRKRVRRDMEIDVKRLTLKMDENLVVL